MARNRYCGRRRRDEVDEEGRKDPAERERDEVSSVMGGPKGLGKVILMSDRASEWYQVERSRVACTTF